MVNKMSGFSFKIEKTVSFILFFNFVYCDAISMKPITDNSLIGNKDRKPRLVIPFPPIPTKFNESSVAAIKLSIIAEPSLSPDSSPAIMNIFNL